MKTTNKTKTAEQFQKWTQRGGKNKREEFKEGFKALKKIEDKRRDAFQEFVHLLDTIDYHDEEPWAYNTKDCSILILETYIELIETYTKDLKTQLKKIKKNEMEVKK